jgi:hypothetical protein
MKAMLSFVFWSSVLMSVSSLATAQEKVQRSDRVRFTQSDVKATVNRENLQCLDQVVVQECK